ncbi:hypothetical protein [Streptomyces sp. TS71-3]|uniref:hypothetical protein n=1 Tax=Streptomyces sp. TS71-3 TaxID=2733862 RepID=UPI001B07ED91|nr:hypothetical protein [Streptomyces sp. TS71-3]GHJ40466.1 hypothetical protein Sm713_60750 [Streptomyces sp. TS71-3]
MEGMARDGSVELLKYLHKRLHDHFRTLHEHRRALQSAAPVFVLEHNLSSNDFELLLAAVRGAVRQGLDIHSRTWWLPFVVYAAEIGYEYVGDEYWPLFAQKTPGWESSPGWSVTTNRQRIKQWFKRFAADYGGAEPKGSFAANFNIIAWPITHAIIPADLQRQLAQLLFESRAVLTAELLSDPHALGACLASRTGGYSERFQIFCSNQSLLGQVAAAMLSGDDEDSPYLVRSTLARLVDDLTNERQSRTWLTRAKHSANLIRSSGFLPMNSGRRPMERGQSLTAVTNPKLLLRQEDGGWRPYLELPDLTPLQALQNQVGQDLRNLRPKVEGRRQPLPRGKLLYPGEVALSTWPRPEIPIIQLERGSSVVNSLIAERCSITQGPWWVFRKQPDGIAVEVKSKVVRPGHEYCLIGRLGCGPPPVPYVAKASVLTEGVYALEMKMPDIIGETEIAQLSTANLSVVTDLSVRPVGLIPGAWDGEGAVDWLAGEPALLAVRSSRATEMCAVTVDGGLPIVLEWPANKPELIFALEDLTVGTHDVGIALLNTDMGATVTSGSLAITICDPHTNWDGTTEGSGIRLFATPARPKLTELWDGRASLSIDGPPNTKAELLIVLRDDAGNALAQAHHSISLPFSDMAWERLADQELHKRKLLAAYEEAESCEVSVSRSGVGFASLVCERGFHPLRWVLTKRRNGEHEARLIDRTDGDDTQVLLYPVEAPLIGERCDSRRPIAVPPSGGLLQATSGNVTAAIVLPPEPNQLRQRPSNRPVIRYTDKSLSEMKQLIFGHHRWLDADVPADPFAHHQREQVLNEATTALVSLATGSRWAHLERKRVPVGTRRPPDVLDEMQELVGQAPKQRAAAQQIASHLWQWADSPAALSEGFARAIHIIAAASGIDDPHTAADFLLALVTRPGSLASWNETERDRLLKCVLRSPVLIRAARFAVLGIEDLREASNELVVGGSR